MPCIILKLLLLLLSRSAGVQAQLRAPRSGSWPQAPPTLMRFFFAKARRGPSTCMRLSSRSSGQCTRSAGPACTCTPQGCASNACQSWPVDSDSGAVTGVVTGARTPTLLHRPLRSLTFSSCCANCQLVEMCRSGRTMADAAASLQCAEIPGPAPPAIRPAERACKGRWRRGLTLVDHQAHGAGSSSGPVSRPPAHGAGCRRRKRGGLPAPWAVVRLTGPPPAAGQLPKLQQAQTEGGGGGAHLAAWKLAGSWGQALTWLGPSTWDGAASRRYLQHWVGWVAG